MPEGRDAGGAQDPGRPGAVRLWPGANLSARVDARHAGAGRPGPAAFLPRASAFDRRAGRVVLVAPITPDDGPGVATWTFDVCTNTWTRMHPNREPPTLWARLVYDVDSDVTLLVSSRSVWAYDLRANTWTEKGAATTASLQAYDPVSGFVVRIDGDDDHQG